MKPPERYQIIESVSEGGFVDKPLHRVAAQQSDADGDCTESRDAVSPLATIQSALCKF
jgi:hypothetical protein